MNAKNITTWIAQHKVRAALIALGILVLVWDWFAIPRLIIAIAMPLAVLSIPLLILASPVIVFMYFRRHRKQSAHVDQAVQGAVAYPEQAPVEQYPEAMPQAAPQRRLTEQEIIDLYERRPELFEGADFGDEIERD